MALIQRGRALVQRVVAVKRSVVETAGDVPACALLVAIVDGVRPGVIHLSLESVGEALVELNGESVVPGLTAVFHLKDLAVPGVRPEPVGEDKQRGGVSANFVARRVVNDIGISLRGGLAEVEIALHEEADAASPDVTGADGQIASQLAIQGQRSLLGIWRVEVLIGEGEGDGAGGESSGAGKDSIEYRCAGLGIVDGNRGLVLTVAEIHGIQRVAMEARIENSVADAKHGAVVEGIGETGARREILIGRVNHAGGGVIRVGDGGLRNLGLLVAQTVVEGQVPVDLPGVLRIEVDVGGADILDRIAELLAE